MNTKSIPKYYSVSFIWNYIENDLPLVAVGILQLKPAEK